MFDDFRPSANTDAARARMAGSWAAAAILYLSMGALIVSATTSATKAVVEKLTQVEFAPPPPPPVQVTPAPAPTPATQPAASPRPKVRRHDLKPPDAVPDERPKESTAALAASEGTGPVEGFLNGVEGGHGTGAAEPPPPPPPSPPKAEPLVPPVALRSNRTPAYSDSARRHQIEGVVVVSFDVLENGAVSNVQIVSGPEELRDGVVKAVLGWRFEPARRGVQPVRFHQVKSIRFRLTDT
jgi:protein TonB